jgi:hypothetical protein
LKVAKTTVDEHSFGQVQVFQFDLLDLAHNFIEL